MDTFVNRVFGLKRALSVTRALGATRALSVNRALGLHLKSVFKVIKID